MPVGSAGKKAASCMVGLEPIALRVFPVWNDILQYATNKSWEQTNHMLTACHSHSSKTSWEFSCDRVKWLLSVTFSGTLTEWAHAWHWMMPVVWYHLWPGPRQTASRAEPRPSCCPGADRVRLGLPEKSWVCDTASQNGKQRQKVLVGEWGVKIHSGTNRNQSATNHGMWSCLPHASSAHGRPLKRHWPLLGQPGAAPNAAVCEA